MLVLMMEDCIGGLGWDLIKGKQTKCYKKPYSVLDSW